MKIRRGLLSRAVEAEMINASAWMKAEELLDSEGDDYVRGFHDGYAHCLELAECLESTLTDDEDPELN